MNLSYYDDLKFRRIEQTQLSDLTDDDVTALIDFIWELNEKVDQLQDEKSYLETKVDELRYDLKDAGNRIDELVYELENLA